MALPSVVPLAPAPPDLKIPNVPISKFDRDRVEHQDGAEQLLIGDGAPFRTHAIGALDGKYICARAAIGCAV